MTSPTPEPSDLPPAVAGHAWCRADGVEGFALLPTETLPSWPAWTVVVPELASAPDVDTTPAAGANTIPEE